MSMCHCLRPGYYFDYYLWYWHLCMRSLSHSIFCRQGTSILLSVFDCSMPHNFRDMQSSQLFLLTPVDQHKQFLCYSIQGPDYNSIQFYLSVDWWRHNFPASILPRTDHLYMLSLYRSISSLPDTNIPLVVFADSMLHSFRDKPNNWPLLPTPADQHMRSLYCSIPTRDYNSILFSRSAD